MNRFRKERIIMLYSTDFLRGVLPAAVLPFNSQGVIQNEEFIKLILWLTKVEGVTGIVVNGHAGEVTSLSREERKKVVELAVTQIGNKKPIISGIACETLEEAILQAEDAERAGASALLVFPPHTWLIGKEPGAPEAYFSGIASAVDLPLIVFQYAQKWGQAAYDEETLLNLTSIDGVVAVKEAIWEISRYEDEYKLLKAKRPNIIVLSAMDEHLLASYVIGADGTLVGFASVVPELVSKMFNACLEENLSLARELNDRLYPLTKCLYKTEPRARMHTRIKEALFQLKVMKDPSVRSPLLPLNSYEKNSIKKALQLSGLIIEDLA